MQTVRKTHLDTEIYRAHAGHTRAFAAHTDICKSTLCSGHQAGHRNVITCGSHHSGIKLKTNYKKINKKSPFIWKQRNKPLLHKATDLLRQPACLVKAGHHPNLSQQRDPPPAQEEEGPGHTPAERKGI